jgi:hypothetical protein
LSEYETLCEQTPAHLDAVLRRYLIEQPPTVVSVVPAGASAA